MNDYHTSNKLLYKERWIANQLASDIKSFPIVVLTGARQVGKSTLLKNESVFKNWKYLSLDDFNVLSQAENAPFSLWQDARNVILDEVQKAPKILSAIKNEVDSNRSKYRFILSGSANLLLMSKIGDSLAGRAVYVTLMPMTLGEEISKHIPDILNNLFTGNIMSLKRRENIITKPYKYMIKGFMPVFLTLKGREEQLRWWEGYVSSYLERDIRQLSQIESLPEYRRVMEAAALRSGQLINQTEISRDIGISQATVFRYLNLLETTCLLRRVLAYSKNRTKRLIKSPKVYYIDPGLSSYLAGCFDEDSLKTAKEAGGIFESMVLLHLTVLCDLLAPKAKIYYWRTTTGKEVDFVLEFGREILPVEVKLSDSIGYKDTEGIRMFLEEYPESKIGVVIYCGDEIKYIADRIIAIPWNVFAGV